MPAAWVLAHVAARRLLVRVLAGRLPARMPERWETARLVAKTRRTPRTRPFAAPEKHRPTAVTCRRPRESCAKISRRASRKPKAVAPISLDASPGSPVSRTRAVQGLLRARPFLHQQDASLTKARPILANTAKHAVKF